MMFFAFIVPSIGKLLTPFAPFVPLFIFIGVVVIALVLAGDKFNPMLGAPGRVGAPNQHKVARKHGRQPGAEIIKRRKVAHKAITRAGYRRGDNYDVQLADIGLLVYQGNRNPKIFRLSDVPTDATHIRPFVFLDLPNLPESGGDDVIRFNLVDGTGKIRFTSSQRYTVKNRRNNFITPDTWLPLADQVLVGGWSLQVRIGDAAPFAIHEFGWLVVGGEARAYFNGDGEIDEAMQEALSQIAEEPLSLNELLADDRGESVPLVVNTKH